MSQYLELNSLTENIDSVTAVYFRKIVNESILMNESMYEEARRKLAGMPERVDYEEIRIEAAASDKDYLISSLPMSKSIDRLYEIIGSNYSVSSSEENNCAIHDSVLFDIPQDVDYELYKEHMVGKLFGSPFVSELLEFIDTKERYFGEVKAWIHSHCEDVPVPSRRDLTGNIQVLYKWIVDLGDGKYQVDRPNHSERIRRVRS